MKIGVDISDLATGRADGTTRYTYELLRRLPGLMPTAPFELYSPREPAPGFRLHGADAPPVYTAGPPRFWTQTGLPVLLHRHKPDLLLMPIQQLPLIRPHGMKTISVVHDLAFHVFSQQFTFKDWGLLHLFTANAVRNADHIIAVSDATAQDIASYYGRHTQISVVHHGVDHDHFRPQSSAELRDSWATLQTAYPHVQAPYILYVGQLQPRKNIGRLVEAFERVAHTDPAVQLVIAGGHGWMQDSLLATIEQSELRDRIILPGRIAQQHLPLLYAHAEVFVLPSLYEGFGMPLLEAMACGTPVVTSKVSSLPEVAGDAAILIDPTDANSIAAGIEQARTEQQVLRERGFSQAASFTWQETARKTAEAIHQTMKT